MSFNPITEKAQAKVFLKRVFAPLLFRSGGWRGATRSWPVRRRDTRSRSSTSLPGKGKVERETGEPCIRTIVQKQGSKDGDHFRSGSLLVHWPIGARFRSCQSVGVPFEVMVTSHSETTKCNISSAWMGNGTFFLFAYVFDLLLPAATTDRSSNTPSCLGFFAPYTTL